MKKIIVIVAVLMFMIPSATADREIFGEFTYDELFILHHALDQEIMKRPEWKEVTVPSGDWIVGVDIPEGDYSITPVTHGYIRVTDDKGDLFFNKAMPDGDTIGKIQLKKAYTVRLENSFVFAPAKGLDF